MNRTDFFTRHLEYLLSFDLDLAKGRQLSWAEAPEAITSKAACDDAPKERSALTVYHALGESHVLGEPAVSGHIVLTQERIDFVWDEDFGEITGRMVLRTLDDALIEASYSGIVRAGQRWPVLWHQAGPGHDHAATIETRAHITTHFETGSTKYNWLVQYQCIGYGKLSLTGGEPSRASFDVYALGA